DRQLVSVVMAGIIEDDDRFDVCPNVCGNPRQQVRDGGDGIVGDNEDADAFAAGARPWYDRARTALGGRHGSLHVLPPQIWRQLSRSRTPSGYASRLRGTPRG